MAQVQVGPIPEAQQNFLAPLSRDIRAALSYVSFYSTDSPFVVQAIQKLQKDLQSFLLAVHKVVFYFKKDSLFFNDQELVNGGDLLKLLQEKNLTGVLMTPGITRDELASCLRRLTQPIAEAEEAKTDSHIQLLSNEDWVEVTTGVSEPSILPKEIPFSPELVLPREKVPASTLDVPFSLDELTSIGKDAAHQPHGSETLGVKANEALLIFVAEAWQHSQLQRKNIGASPEMAGLTQSFEKLFERLLDRMEKTSPEFGNIYQWFKSHPGQLLEGQVVSSMFPLLEVAVRNNWTAVFFDPATEGLVNECLTYWGANGQHELVDRTVTCLAEGLNGDILERQIALTHLMDARPWVRNPELLEKVLDQLNTQLANETYAALYQSALLLAWDLIEPAIQKGKEQPVLTLLSTLHFQADEDVANFPERSRIARHWLFERSTPELIRQFVRLAFNAGQLNHFPLLGEMAAPILLKNFLAASPADKSGYFHLFAEIKDPIQSVLGECLAEAQDEAQVAQLIPVLRVCGLDGGISLLLSSWLSKGSRELKMNLISMIEEVNDKAGGPALRLAVFDDSEEIAAMSARVIGKIHFNQGLQVLLKASKIRESRFADNDLFLTSVSQALGDLGMEEALPFLQDIARKKPLLRGKNFSLPVRLEAIQAMTKINKPEVWHFMETLMEEKNPALQEALEKIIEDRTKNLT